MLGGGNPVSGGNPAGVSQSLAYMGKNKYAGWSGEVIATAGTNGTLFDFTSPSNTALETAMSLMINKTGLGGDESVGFLIKIDDQVIGNYLSERGSTFGFMDIDPVLFFIPAQARIKIEAVTGDSSNITFTACLVCTGVFD
tara:strand:- start:43 stop:465 length:423 start_codon:yes stop_codon:yes gene_type:complete